MAVTVSEKINSRSTTESSAIYRYNVHGTNDEPTARFALLAAAPVLVTVGGLSLVRQKASLDYIGDGGTAHLWNAAVSYGYTARKSTGESSYSFATGGGTETRFQADDETVYVPAGDPTPNFQKAIGVDEEGKVQGCDVIVPKFAWTETHYIIASAVDDAYKATLYGLTGCKNDDTFRGFDAGEVLFHGADGSQRGEEDWAINFSFEASPNVTGHTIGTVTGINKLGWDYLWTRYATDTDATANILIKKPIAVIVNKVVPDGDFSNLGI